MRSLESNRPPRREMESSRRERQTGWLSDRQAVTDRREQLRATGRLDGAGSDETWVVGALPVPATSLTGWLPWQACSRQGSKSASDYKLKSASDYGIQALHSGACSRRRFWSPDEYPWMCGVRVVVRGAASLRPPPVGGAWRISSPYLG